MNKETFKQELKKLNIEITREQEQMLEKYYNLLIETNKTTNLTRITNKEEVYLKHFYDSLTISKVINLTNQKIIDIGTGAGFPGIVLKIIYKDLNITLLDSSKKRIDFLNKVIKELNLTNIKTIHERIENYKEEQFDIVTSRAVAKTNMLLELSCNLAKINGYYIFLKGNLEEELTESQNAIKKLNLKLIKKEQFHLPIENSKRTIIKIQKQKNSPKEYPRNFAKIKKNPL